MVTGENPCRLGLVGEKLSHSFSKLIHEKLAPYSYDLIEISKENLGFFFENRAFSAVNVTIPYKEAVLPYLDFTDESVKIIGSVNTVVNKNGKLFGYNTDFFGFNYLLKKSNIELNDKIVLILGSGGTCKTAFAAATAQGAREILIASRTKSSNTITYEQALSRQDTQILINTTPVGMFPQNEQQPIDLLHFKSLEAVVDVIYNPLKTNLLLQAEQLNIKSSNGLIMLVAQAKLACEHFHSIKIADETTDQICNELAISQSNLVLIGMPACGKSVLGKICAQKLNRTLVDIDKIIVQRENMPIEKIFSTHGEGYFRELESDVIAEFSKQNGLVISTGGGSVKAKKNIISLKQNGVICFIDRTIDKLFIGRGRPLSSDKASLQKLLDERYDQYVKCSDFTVKNNGNLTDAADEIIKSYTLNSL